MTPTLTFIFLRASLPQINFPNSLERAFLARQDTCLREDPERMTAPATTLGGSATHGTPGDLRSGGGGSRGSAARHQPRLRVPDPARERDGSGVPTSSGGRLSIPVSGYTVRPCSDSATSLPLIRPPSDSSTCPPQCLCRRCLTCGGFTRGLMGEPAGVITVLVGAVAGVVALALWLWRTIVVRPSPDPDQPVRRAAAGPARADRA
jgi:hypothetical protein